MNGIAIIVAVLVGVFALGVIGAVILNRHKENKLVQAWENGTGQTKTQA